MSASIVGITPEISLHPTLHPELHNDIRPDMSMRPHGDLSFKFSDKINVNCFTNCCPRPWQDHDIVYINKRGEIEPFKRISKRVIRPRKEYEKSYRRMKAFIVQNLQSRNENVEETLKQIEKNADVNFDRSIQRGSILHLETVRRINRALKEYNIHSPHSPSFQGK